MPDQAAEDKFQELRDRIAKEEEEKNSILGSADQREMQARELASKVFAAARELNANGKLNAIGYRVMVKPLDAIKGLEEAEKDIAPHLAEQGFQVKSDKEKEKEERGEQFGVVITMGDIAFERHGGRAAWCDVGDLVCFSRYAGTRVEHPPKSGNFYQIMNDEDVFGKVS